jgi:Domain of unknown function (DUF2804), N-terminal/Domain of unknown function (DUF2804), C-terminal
VAAVREITTPVALCDARGRLAPHAIGWSRRPLHDARLRGSPLRKKRWEYWAVVGERHTFQLTLADIDYAALGIVTVGDLDRGRFVDRVRATPLAWGLAIDDTVGGPIALDTPGLHASVTPIAGGATILRARARGIDAEIAVDAPAETLNVVVPLPGGNFHYTSKQVGLRARGRVVFGGRTIDFDHAWACLDFGRGVVPWRAAWQWAAAASDRLAFNLGGTWTDGTGITENALFVDGRVHKLDGDVRFAADAITGPRVDLRFRAERERRVRVELGLGAARLWWRFGRFDGTIVTDDGAPLIVQNLRGWSEDFTARW